MTGYQRFRLRMNENVPRRFLGSLIAAYKYRTKRVWVRFD